MRVSKDQLRRVDFQSSRRPVYVTFGLETGRNKGLLWQFLWNARTCLFEVILLAHEMDLTNIYAWLLSTYSPKLIPQTFPVIALSF